MSWEKVINAAGAASFFGAVMATAAPAKRKRNKKAKTDNRADLQPGNGTMRPLPFNLFFRIFSHEPRSALQI